MGRSGLAAGTQRSFIPGALGEHPLLVFGFDAGRIGLDDAPAAAAQDAAGQVDGWSSAVDVDRGGAG
jgi:hypothetical protein